MSERFPPINPSDLTTEQKEAYNHMSQTADKYFGATFTYKTPSGAFLGPFAQLINTPALCKPFFAFMSAVSAMPGLPAAARETAVLATGSHYQAPYEIYAHERVALEKTSLNKEQINMIKRGKKPDDLGQEESVAFDASMELVTKKGPLGKERWDEVAETFGRDGAAALLQYVGLYAYTCVLLNGCDMQLPQGEKIWE